MADATKKVIAATVQVDTGNSNAELAQTNAAIGKTDASLNKLQADTTKANKTFDETSGKFSNLKEGLNGLPGPAGSAVSGVNSLGSAFKALIANPVGLVLTAIVGVLTLLYKAFTNTFEGAHKVEQVFAGIKAAAQSLLDNLDKIGGAIVKIFKFDFSGAYKDMKGVAAAAGEAYTAMSKLTAQAQDLKKEQLQNDLEAAERQKKLAILREQATDETVPVAKRKAALLELKKDAEQNAVDDIKLAKKIADNKIAQLTLEKDGERKNQEEINAIRIEQIKGETENAGELRKINKSITAAEKEENAERKEQQKIIDEQNKERRAQLAAYNAALLKVQQENELGLIKDGYEKELKALQFKIDGEKQANLKAVEDKKLTAKQAATINAEIDKSFQIQKDALDKKQHDDQLKKEADFQKELNEIKKKTAAAGIVDQREIERKQIEIGYNEKLKDAEQRYKDDAAHLSELRLALEEQFHAEQGKLEEKFRIEDAKKQLALQTASLQDVVNDTNQKFDVRLAALDAETAAVQAGFDAQLISEEEFTKKSDELSKARVTIAQQEAQAKIAAANSVGNALGALSNLIGQQTIAGKALAVAQALINTYTGATEALKQPSTLPSPFDVIAKVANVTTVIATGLAAVKKIVSTQVPGGGGGGNAAAGGGALAVPAPAAPVAPTQQSTSLNADSINAVGNAVSGRSYVLESDGANARERNERLNRAARLGG